MQISPKYQLKLAKNVAEAIWKEYSSYKEAQLYLEKWHESDYFNNYENFVIMFKMGPNNTPLGVDVLGTVSRMPGDILLKVAIDIGVDTPDFIPSIPVFKNELNSSYQTASSTFAKALKNVEDDPNLAIGLANSALESIIKEILKDVRFSSKTSGNETTYKLAQIIIKEFNLTSEEHPTEVKTICNNFISICQQIEKIRSEQTEMHGKTNGDVIISDSIFAYFIVNSVTTIGLFLNSFYKNKYPKAVKQPSADIDDLPF